MKHAKLFNYSNPRDTMGLVDKKFQGVIDSLFFLLLCWGIILTTFGEPVGNSSRCYMIALYAKV